MAVVPGSVKVIHGAATPPVWDAKNKVMRESHTTNSRKILRYPSDIISADTDYIKLDLISHHGKGSGFSDATSKIWENKATTQVGKKKDITLKSLAGGSVREASRTLWDAKTDQSIILPIPQDIKDSNSTGWGRNEINDWAAWGINAMTDATKTNDLGDAWAVLKATAIDAGGSVSKSPGSGAIDLLKANLTAGAANALGSNVTANGLLGRVTGQIINSNVELLFSSVTIRSFNFNWNISPRNKNEAQEVKDIIRVLKKRSTAKKDADKSFGFLNAPDLFRISYMKGSGKHPFLNAFKHCALTNISVNYTASGTYATYDDGTPIHMQLGLSFQELNPIYAEDYDDSNAGEGVGY